MSCGIDHAVDDVRIAASSDVVESATNREIVAEQVKAFFKLRIQREVERESLRARSTDELLLWVEQAEGESSASFDRVGKFGLVKNRQLEKRGVSPG